MFAPVFAPVIALLFRTMIARPYAPSDVLRISIETDVHLDTVRDVLFGGHLRSRQRIRVYRYLVKHDALGWIQPREVKS